MCGARRSRGRHHGPERGPPSHKDGSDGVRDVPVLPHDGLVPRCPNRASDSRGSTPGGACPSAVPPARDREHLGFRPQMPAAPNDGLVVGAENTSSVGLVCETPPTRVATRRNVTARRSVGEAPPARPSAESPLGARKPSPSAPGVASAYRRVGARVEPANAGSEATPIPVRRAVLAHDDRPERRTIPTPAVSPTAAVIGAPAPVQASSRALRGVHDTAFRAVMIWSRVRSTCRWEGGARRRAAVHARWARPC